MPVTYYRNFLRDIAERTETAMPQRLVFNVCRLALRAQAGAVRYAAASAAVIGVAIIGLGNALQPHARSLVDLADRARVVWAAASTEARLASVAERYGFPTTTDIARAIADPAVDAVMVLTPANAHLPIAEAAFAAGKHVFLREAAGGVDRTRRTVDRGGPARRTAAGDLSAIALPARQPSLEGSAGRGRTRDDPGGNHVRAVVAAAILLRRTRARREGARRRRRIDHAGDS